ncbi:hypothetical protein SUGI_0670960 [Cryptomeria japonica]|nr:hypothetical protein SUGI_0670960 [Cryptomeria japonica]
MASYGMSSQALYPLPGNPPPRLISPPVAVSSFRPEVDKNSTWVCARIPISGLPYTYHQHNSLSLRDFHCTARNFAPLQENYKVKSANPCNPTLTRASMDSKKAETIGHSQAEPQSMKVLFVEMGVGYDQHGQDITAAAMRACRDAISSNSIPAFRTGAVPGVNFDQMKLKIKLGVPQSTQGSLDIERVKSVFPYGNIGT